MTTKKTPELSLSEEENYEPIGVDEIEKAELEEVSKEDDPETVPEKPDNTGYQMFTRFARMKLRKTRPDLHFGQINHHLAKLWKKEQIKEKWEKKHALKMIDYYFKMATFLDAHPDYVLPEGTTSSKKRARSKKEEEEGPDAKRQRSHSAPTTPIPQPILAPSTPVSSNVSTMDSPPSPPASPTPLTPKSSSLKSTTNSGKKSSDKNAKPTTTQPITTTPLHSEKNTDKSKKKK